MSDALYNKSGGYYPKMDSSFYSDFSKRDNVLANDFYPKREEGFCCPNRSNDWDCSYFVPKINVDGISSNNFNYYLFLYRDFNSYFVWFSLKISY